MLKSDQGPSSEIKINNMIWKIAQESLSKDKYIGPLITKYGDCKIKVKHHKDFFEDLCGAIIGQQLSGKVADVIFGRFKKAVGTINPKNILSIPDQKLRDCGMSWGKVSFIKDLAAKTKSGELKTKKLADLPDDEVKKELIAVKGIGNWTAEMFLMFALGRPDIFPVDDLGIRKGIVKLVGPSFAKASKGEVEKFAERWKPYRTVASWYIWKNLDNKQSL